MAEVSGSGEIRRADDVGKTPIKPRQVVAIVVVVVLVIIAVQNLDEQTLNILLWDVSMPLVVLLAAFGLGGFLAGWLVRGRREKRQRDND
jgi:uncharacterized integral membrane protein